SWRCSAGSRGNELPKIDSDSWYWEAPGASASSETCQVSPAASVGLTSTALANTTATLSSSADELLVTVPTILPSLKERSASIFGALAVPSARKPRRTPKPTSKLRTSDSFWPISTSSG